MPIAKTCFAIIVALWIGFALGHYHHKQSVQSANDLLDAGFTIVDPEGYEVERFE
jgi:hypothetical protein